jgi:hypothetical protein
MVAMKLPSLGLNLLLVFEEVLHARGAQPAPPNACISANGPRATR